jgi:hypothetical protein
MSSRSASLALRNTSAPGLIVQTAQVIRVDATLEVGSAAESVTVNEEAPLLKTESGDVSQTVATQTMDALPLLILGTDTYGLRNPYNVVALLPGAYYAPPTPGGVGTTVHLNGSVKGSETLLITLIPCYHHVPDVAAGHRRDLEPGRA